MYVVFLNSLPPEEVPATRAPALDFTNWVGTAKTQTVIYALYIVPALTALFLSAADYAQVNSVRSCFLVPHAQFTTHHDAAADGKSRAAFFR